MPRLWRNWSDAMRNEFVQALLSQAEKNERIWLLTGDLGFTVLEPFRDRSPSVLSMSAWRSKTWPASPPGWRIAA